MHLCCAVCVECFVPLCLLLKLLYLELKPAIHFAILQCFCIIPTLAIQVNCMQYMCLELCSFHSFHSYHTPCCRGLISLFAMFSAGKILRFRAVGPQLCFNIYWVMTPFPTCNQMVGLLSDMSEPKPKPACLTPGKAWEKKFACYLLTKAVAVFVCTVVCS